MTGLSAAAVFALADPPLIRYATFLGPSAVATSVAADAQGFLYAAGWFNASEFPCSIQPAGTSNESERGFVIKLQPGGDGAVWTACTPMPVRGVAVDRGGTVYVSTSNATASAVLKLSPADGKLLYIAPVRNAVAAGIAVDASGSAYVTGAASPGLATTSAAYQPSLPCPSGTQCSDGFVVRLSPGGGPIFGTYMGTGGGRGTSIAVDSHGDAWVAGTSNGFKLPPPDDRTLGSSSLIAKFDSTGSRRLFYNAFGGGGSRVAIFNSYGADIAVDAKDSVHMTGTIQFLTTTPGSLRPSRTTINPTAYVIKRDATGAIIYSTYSANDDEVPTAIATDRDNNTYVALLRFESNPPCYAIRSRVTVINPEGTKVIASSPLGFAPRTLSMGPGNTVFAAGYVNAPETAPFLHTPGAFQTGYSGGADSLAVKLDFSVPARAGTNCLAAVSAASLRPGRNPRGPNGSVAPGELISIFANEWNPTAPLTVQFDGKPAPILFADKNQINTIVPFGIGPLGSFTQMTIRNGSQTVGPLDIPVTEAVPGLFATPSGQLAALNQDGSINSAANPAEHGSIVTVYMTGAGAFDLPMNVSERGPLQPPFPKPVLPVSITVSGPGVAERYPGLAAEVLFAGQAPGLPAGVVQVNFRVPASAGTGNMNVVAWAGYYSSLEQRVTIAVR